MSLTRYLPLPSDRMGIIWNLLTISDGIVLEYGPAGTTHFSMSLFGELGADKENRLFTTHISEEDVVMGDVKRLENALVELDETYHPKVIFVVASSIVAVIGTDMKGVCRYMQERVKARLVPFLQGGFRGDYSLGCAQVWETLADESVLHPASEKERLDIMKSLHRQLVLGDDSSLRCRPEDNVKYRICMPVIAGAQIANHLPLAGERGADALLEKIEEYFQMVN